MYKHTLLIDNGFGSRQCLLSWIHMDFGLPSEGHSINPLHTGFHQYLLSGMLPESFTLLPHWF